MKKRMLCCLLALVLAVGLLSACGSGKAAVYVQSVAALTGYGSLGGANASSGVVVGRPKLLLADEPTGALDSAAGNQIMDIFDALNDAGSTIIMITHEQEIAERAKRINYIRDGILSDGRRDGESLA